MTPKVAVIVLNWNNAADTLRCLHSLSQLDYEAHHVIVVDNGSSDGSVATIEASYPGVTILQSQENLGYAGGNNLGTNYALRRGFDYFWLLNDDVIAAPDSLSALMVQATAEPKAGFLGPKVYTLEEPKTILSAGGEFGPGWQALQRGMGELERGQFDQTVETDFLSGCALLVSRKLIETVGGLDEDFFAYYEEIEWCHRGRNAGFRVLFVPDSKIWHPDTRLRDSDSTLVMYYISRNRLLFLAKHRLGAGAIIRCLATYLLWVVNWWLNPKWRHKRSQRDALIRSMMDFTLGRFGRAEWVE
jgi:GT2 family glycosyltransferase